MSKIVKQVIPRKKHRGGPQGGHDGRVMPHIVQALAHSPPAEQSEPRAKTRRRRAGGQ